MSASIGIINHSALSLWESPSDNASIFALQNRSQAKIFQAPIYCFKSEAVSLSQPEFEAEEEAKPRDFDWVPSLSRDCLRCEVLFKVDSAALLRPFPGNSSVVC
jgi:hypothetical protein